jgi:hypothetical protein
MVGGKVEVQRLTDQNYIPLAGCNVLVEAKECNEFIKEYIEVPVSEVKGELEALEKKRIHVLYQYVESKGQCITLGIQPNVPFSDVHPTFNS